MKRFYLALISIVLGCAVSVAQISFAAEPVQIKTPYAYATAPSAQNGAVFFHAKGNDDRIVSADTDIAKKVELHTHIHEDGIMRMRQVKAFDLPAKLAPSGDHIMLLGLKNPLEAGKTFPLTLTFEKAGQKILNVQIVTPGTIPDDY